MDKLIKFKAEKVENTQSDRSHIQKSSKGDSVQILSSNFQDKHLMKLQTWYSLYNSLKLT